MLSQEDGQKLESLREIEDGDDWWRARAILAISPAEVHFCRSRPHLPFNRLHFPVWQIYPPKLCDFVLLYPDGGNGKCSKLSSQCCFVSLLALLIGRIICSAHANKGSLSWEEMASLSIVKRRIAQSNLPSLGACLPLHTHTDCQRAVVCLLSMVYVDVDGALWAKATWHCHYKWLFSWLTQRCCFFCACCWQSLDPMCLLFFASWPDDAPLVVAAAICVESPIASNLILSFAAAAANKAQDWGHCCQRQALWWICKHSSLVPFALRLLSWLLC